MRGALTRRFGLSLVLLLPCWCSRLLRGGLVWGVLPLPVVLLAVSCLLLLVLAVCWWLCLLLPFLLLGFVLLVPSSVVVAVVGVLSVLLLVVVGGCCCGCPLAVCLLLGLGFPGFLRAVGGSVLPFLLPCSCRYSSPLPLGWGLFGSHSPDRSQRRSPVLLLLANLQLIPL